MKRDSENFLDALAREAMLERGFIPDFPPEIAAELERMGGPAAPSPDARDERSTPFFSIDNDESRDLDQLTWAERRDDSIIIRVAVADVERVVARGGAIDERARENTTSVYTPTEVFHMLPEQLSTDWTSLNPGEDRMAVVIEAEVAADGSIHRGAVYEALVHNYAKLTYENVGAWLGGSAPLKINSPYAQKIEENIRLQIQATHRLLQRRHELGALDLETIEARPVVENGRVVRLEIAKPDDARQIIQDFMIASNGVVARFLAQKDFPVFRRVVRTPKRWSRIVQVAEGEGEKLPEEPDSVALQEFLLRMKRKDPVTFPDLSLTIVKLLGRGEYAVDAPGSEGPGHFGLAVDDYTHSTAPNRRYPDLITHRLIKAAIAGKESPYSLDELQELAAHCTSREDDANRVQRYMQKAAAAELMLDRVGHRFDGIITGASKKGTWLRLFDPPVEGKLVEGHQDLDVGDRVSVKLLSADPERGFIDFARIRQSR